jgi:ketosteroid isomerase-like protein
VTSRLIVVIGLAALLATACAPLPPAVGPAPRGDLPAREAGFLAALAARDAERTAAHFADDAVLHVAGMPAIRGRDAIRAFYGNVFRFLESSAPVSGAVRASRSGDMGWSEGQVTNRFRGADGPVEFAGKYLIVWERQGQEWLIAAYSLGNDAAEARR